MNNEQLMNQAGACDNAVSAFEHTHGCRPTGPLMDEYNRLLLASSDAKAALRCHMAEVSGVWSWSLFVKPERV